MRIIDKPLLWLYIKTRDSALSSMRGFTSLLLVMVIWTMALGSEPSQNALVNFFSILLILGLPLSIGLMMLRYKFRNVGASIPRAELACLLQYKEGIELENAVKGFFSFYLSLMIYFLFTMILAAALISIVLVFVA
ncbi:hypothetical protein DLH98_11280 [Vibrio parahaemolyticus]|uniref:hypothetical protein n=1 Tax=Vibrio parahaemolyticus TaxID=670 RepID=UPI0004A394F3|nr:hypothetical protein [Vibrio parahaemolyticus]EGQ8922733.1 hypothetical protein [Vibrio parahaemolyticus]EGR2856880.1 hypothetical protein [Vibrio parahaemolyticus]EGR2945927.1 hypothetical protein [Vibrio parahaemolyticus]EGR3064773.1 hypothetical protein [Vibrio parahaemolyticus]EGR3140867.1 hypothetical protein [Vibrio parahaemolyticus]